MRLNSNRNIKSKIPKAFKLTILACLLLFSAIIWTPQIMGWSVRTILTDSMSPSIKAGSLAFVKESSKTNIKIGDVLLYQAENQTIPTLHRVKNVIQDTNGTLLELKGDANEFSDFTKVSLDQVEGKLIMSINSLGYAIEYGQKHTLLIALFLLFILFSNNFRRGNSGAHHESA